MTGYEIYHNRLVVGQTPLKNIDGVIIPNVWKNEKGSEAPTRQMGIYRWENNGAMFSWEGTE